MSELQQDGQGFDTDAYFAAQMDSFAARVDDQTSNVIEFGGKPFGDYHAARVLPGYEADIKADIIRGLSDTMGRTELALVVNAQDLLQDPDGRRVAKRIRGDTQLTYDEEILRMADEADERFNLAVDNVVVSVVPRGLVSVNEDYLGGFADRLAAHFERVHLLPQVEGYPNQIPDDQVVERLTTADPVAPQKNLILMSAGGGSGKFGVAASEIVHHLEAGVVPNFIKFETFPVFALPERHPLNQAFLAATADLPNELTTLGNGLTNYMKDVENLALLRQIIAQYPHLSTGRLEFPEPTDMGVNVIERGITDIGIVAAACQTEIAHRVARYRQEVSRGVEVPDTLARTQQYAAHLALDQLIA